MWLGVGISSLYLLLTCGLKFYALKQFEDALSRQNIEYDELIVKPTAFNTILWNANVATKDAYLLGEMPDWESLNLLPGEANIIFEGTS